ncbi:hypothetical protein [Bacillus sp. REN10]|uniref:hypothetical protein n=1 Tax=Bacillus sp. REN10 TaxID=2782541 RepID=UPI00193BE814|nr:hypothetical protein [Bacillus sp. REN10]
MSNIWEIAGITANIVAATSAALAAIFTYSTVKTAMSTNKLAAKQIEMNREYQEKSLRPSIYIKKSSFDINLGGDFLSDWENDTEQYRPRYASDYCLLAENLGNVPARNIEYSVGIENIEEIKKIIEKNETDIKRRTQVGVKFKEDESQKNVYNVQFLRTYDGYVKCPTFKATHYIEELGYLKSYQSTENFSGEIYLPKLFLIFINILRDQIGIDYLLPKLIIKFKYFDPYSTCYYQSFVLTPVIRNYDMFNPNKYFGYFEVKELINKKCDE